MDYFERAKELMPEMVEARRYIHKNAEVGFLLPMSTAFVMKKLIELDYEPREICNSGIVATIGKPGKCVLLRADMDALPMPEETGLPFASTNPLAAHTCGHDLHTAALLGTARLLRENESALDGTVKLMFQPGEEIFWGAKEMIAHGVLENPAVNIAFAGHVTPRYKTGNIAMRSGPAMASCDFFRINIKGKATHGSVPNQGVSPINIAVHIYLAMQELISREVNFQSGHGASLTLGSFQAGNVPNTIPDDAVLLGTLRSFDEEERRFLLERLRCLTENTAKMFRGTATLEIMTAVPILHNNPTLCRCVGRYFRELFGRDALEDSLIYGSEDFAFVSERVPTVDLYVGAVHPDYDGPFYASHHSKIVFDEDALAVSAALGAEVATRWLAEHTEQ